MGKILTTHAGKETNHINREESQAEKYVNDMLCIGCRWTHITHVDLVTSKSFLMASLHFYLPSVGLLGP